MFEFVHLFDLFSCVCVCVLCVCVCVCVCVWQSLLTGAEGAGDRRAGEEGRGNSFQVRGAGAEIQQRNVLAQVQAAAARKLQEKLAFLDRERLAAKDGGGGGGG